MHNAKNSQGVKMDGDLNEALRSVVSEYKKICKNHTVKRVFRSPIQALPSTVSNKLSSIPKTTLPKSCSS